MGRGWYVAAGACALAGTAAAVALVVLLVQALGTDPQFLAPGRFSVAVEEPGKVVIWHDHRTLFQGVRYDAPEALPAGARIRAVEEASGQNPRFMKPGYTPPDEYRRMWEALRGGREWRGEFRNRRKDGTLYWERASISPVFNAQGEIANFMAVTENITEFKEADEARRLMEERGYFPVIIPSLAFSE